MRNLNPTAVQVLSLCAMANRPKSVRQLAEDLLLIPSTVRSTCEALERHGLLEATYLALGGRTVRHFVVTPAGVDAEAAAIAVDEEEAPK